MRRGDVQCFPAAWKSWKIGALVFLERSLPSTPLECGVVLWSIDILDINLLLGFN